MLLAQVHDNTTDSEKRLDFGYILQVESKGFINNLNMEMRDGRVRNDSTVTRRVKFVLPNWERLLWYRLVGQSE